MVADFLKFATFSKSEFPFKLGTAPHTPLPLFVTGLVHARDSTGRIGGTDKGKCIGKLFPSSGSRISELQAMCHRPYSASVMEGRLA